MSQAKVSPKKKKKSTAPFGAERLPKLTARLLDNKSTKNKKKNNRKYTVLGNIILFSTIFYLHWIDCETNIG
jgi:hypothetical protein